MTSPVTNSVPFSYLGVLKPATPAIKYSGSAALPSSGVSPTPSNNGAPKLSAAVISLLQSFSPSNALHQTPALLGGNGSKLFSPLSSTVEGSALYANYASSVTAAYQNAASLTHTNAPDRLQSLLSGYRDALNTGNTSNWRQSQSVIDANSFGADGVTPLVLTA